MNSTYSNIVALASDRDITGLQTTYIGLLRERMRMDKFFTMFLDEFDSKMNIDDTETKIWKLYKKKLKEYDDLQKTIKAAEYYMKKNYA
jgi:hypothetical protein